MQISHRNRINHEISCVYACDICYMQFGTKRALAVHAFKKHGVKRRMRNFVHGSVCEMCLAEFHTCEGLVCHLEEKSPRCRGAYTMYYGEGYVQSDRGIHIQELQHSQTAILATKGWRRNKATEPSYRIDGPLLGLTEMAGISHDLLLRGSWVGEQ